MALPTNPLAENQTAQHKNPIQAVRQPPSPRNLQELAAQDISAKNRKTRATRAPTRKNQTQAFEQSIGGPICQSSLIVGFTRVLLIAATS